MSKLRYRPDVDGLRAAAVAGVLLFHADMPLVGGGFAGVDIFFFLFFYFLFFFFFFLISFNYMS